MRKVKQSINGKSKVCAVHPLIDITLCGNALEGDRIDNMSLASVVNNKTKITCENCKKIISYCKSDK